MSGPRRRTAQKNLDSAAPVEKHPLESASDMDTTSIIAALRRQPVWIVLAVSSGACAAFNGVFAKLYSALVDETAGKLGTDITSVLGPPRP